MKIKKLLTIFTVLMLADSLASCGRSNETRQEMGNTRQQNILPVSSDSPLSGNFI